MRQVKITFLMTAFNSRCFIRQAIDSVLNQTETDIRLIIRNNASTDDTGEICKAYAEKDARVIYLENRTSYLSDEGNTVYQRGWWPKFDSEFVAILDHDDILDADFASRMYEAAVHKQADMAVCGNTFFMDATGKTVGERIAPDLYTTDMAVLGKQIDIYYGLFRTIWAKLYRTEFFDQYYEEAYHTPDNLKLSMDTYRVFTYLEHCRSFVCLQSPLYHYRKSSQSQFNSNKLATFRIGEADALFDKALEFLEQFHMADTDNINFLYQVHWGHMTDLLKILVNSSVDVEEKLNYIQEILKNKKIEVYGNNSVNLLMDTIHDHLDRMIKFCGYESPAWHRYYIFRLYKTCHFPHPDNDNLLYISLLSGVMDTENTYHLGLPLLQRDWGSMSAGSLHFKNLNTAQKQALISDPVALRQLLAFPKNPEDYRDLEDQLVAECENENWEAAASLISQLNQTYPVDEYATYYRLYLSCLTGDTAFAKKQACISSVFWPDSPEITELCDHIHSLPCQLERHKTKICFTTDFFNTDVEKFDDFEYFCSFISQYSVPSLIDYFFAETSRRRSQAIENETYSFQHEDALSIAGRSSVGCFKSMLEGGATVLDAIGDLKKNIRAYKNLHHLLHDQISKNTLRDILLFRFLGDHYYLKRCACSQRQYYDTSLMPEQEYAVFVDCGAYNGLTVQEYIEVYGCSYSKIYAFEPAPDNYETTLSALKDEVRVSVINKGLSDRPGVLQFTSSLPGAANRLHPTGDQSVEVTTLDNEIADKISFIKMDIEGAEQSALAGAKRHIVQDKPQMAICLYHLIDDIWKIPALILELCPSYELDVRYHFDGSIPEEIVLYARPKL